MILRASVRRHRSYLAGFGRSGRRAQGDVETIAQIHQADPVAPKKFQLSIPGQVGDAVILTLAKRPGMRDQTPAEAARALKRIAK
jgi:hypothetical protein